MTSPDNGPGKYNIEIPIGGKAYTFGEKRETKVEDSLGPGQYSPEKADPLVKPASIAHKI